MQTKWLGACAVLGLAIVVTAGRADDGSRAEIAKLGAKVKELEAENQALRAEVVRLKDRQYKIPGGKADEARLDADLRLLEHLGKTLKEKPNDQAVRAEAAALATRLAPRLPGNLWIWWVLLTTRTLKDGLSLADAEKLLGPATGKSDKHVDWYFNPRNRHVAPCLSARVTKEGLVEWDLGMR